MSRFAPFRRWPEPLKAKVRNNRSESNWLAVDVSMKILLGILSVYFFSTGIFIWSAPHAFYEMTPGLSTMGPFNMHFILDVALTFLVSGGAMAYGVFKDNRGVLICGAAWPFLHALYHLQIWGHRGFPFDIISASDFAGVIMPGFAALTLALIHKNKQLINA